MGAQPAISADPGASGRGTAAGLILWLLLALGFLIQPSPAVAADTETPAAAMRAHSLLLAGDDTRVRLVLHFDGEPANARWMLLKNPHRLVIDLPQTRLHIDPEAAAARGIVTGVRYGQMGEDASRMILQTEGPFVVEGFDVLANESSGGFRLVADLVAASEPAFRDALSEQLATTGSTRSTAKGDRVLKSGTSDIKPFTIVIDPGHGGIDSGAEGTSGTVEKTITLAFALELRKRLAKSGRYVVHMTRERDVFLRLDERVRIARQHGADLFVSVHADTIKFDSVRGATVYTVSDQASDADAAALAARENLSDELAGLSVEDQNHQVSDILMDLIRRETHAFSIRFARTLLGELDDKVELIKNPHRYAGFRVLKAPDVPSVLLELGYLSNAEDEKQLRSAEWRAKAVDSIATAIDLFAGARVRTGG